MEHEICYCVAFEWETAVADMTHILQVIRSIRGYNYTHIIPIPFFQSLRYITIKYVL